MCREATEAGNKPEGVARGNWIIPDILESEDLPTRSQPCPLHTQGSGQPCTFHMKGSGMVIVVCIKPDILDS